MFWQLLAFNGNLNRYYTFREREKNSKKTADFFSAWTYSNFLQPLSPWINYTFPHLLVGFEVFFPKNGWNLWEHMRTHQQCYLCCFRFQLDDLNLMKSHWPCSLVNSYRMYFSSQFIPNIGSLDPYLSWFVGSLIPSWMAKTLTSQYQRYPKMISSSRRQISDKHAIKYI